MKKPKFMIPSRDMQDILKEEEIETDRIRIRFSDEPSDWIEIGLVSDFNKFTEKDVLQVSSGWSIGLTVSPRACNVITIGKGE